MRTPRHSRVDYWRLDRAALFQARARLCLSPGRVHHVGHLCNCAPRGLGQTRQPSLSRHFPTPPGKKARFIRLRRPFSFIVIKTRAFTNDHEVAALVLAFESAEIAAADFSHQAHIAVALSYLEAYPADVALDRMRHSIVAFAQHHGVNHLYHETLTVFWMRLLGHLSALYHVDLSLWQRINLIVERWGTRTPMDAHFSPELIGSAAAREGWVDPDRLPLPF